MPTTPTGHDRQGTDTASRTTAHTVGALFLFSTAAFLVGDALIQEYFSTETGSLVAGVLLQTVCGLAVVGIGLALRRTLGRYSRTLADAYLVTRCLECAAIGAIGVYLLATKSQFEQYELLIYLFSGIAGLILSFVLLRTGLVPSWLAWLGLVGYGVLLLAIPAGLLDIATLDSGPGMLMYVPGGLFELILPILLIAKGFRPFSVRVAGPGRERMPATSVDA
ncbi:DUF4386 domain-containing protein [Rhodococcus maanshanensis]|uniref:DUF4386 domain-containing protein n=1 Tax=Rhodococcus maanshanensis TaxID=183556 RepID=A0A1H7KEC9_9NOCA|nr:DUF4386 domain-containing protein [Rhodococcus maanshanensis]SEK85223.1 protein of unknown function [Rhodococcus maanshanensis]